MATINLPPSPLRGDEDEKPSDRTDRFSKERSADTGVKESSFGSNRRRSRSPPRYGGKRYYDGGRRQSYDRTKRRRSGDEYGRSNDFRRGPPGKYSRNGPIDSDVVYNESGQPLIALSALDRNMESRDRRGRRSPPRRSSDSRHDSRKDDGPIPYKQWLLDQPDDIGPMEAQKMYDEYQRNFAEKMYEAHKEQWQMRVLEKFYEDHSNEEWFRQKYDPVELEKVVLARIKEVKESAKKWSDELLGKLEELKQKNIDLETYSNPDFDVVQRIREGEVPYSWSLDLTYWLIEHKDLVDRILRRSAETDALHERLWGEATEKKEADLEKEERMERELDDEDGDGEVRMEVIEKNDESMVVEKEEEKKEEGEEEKKEEGEEDEDEYGRRIEPWKRDLPTFPTALVRPHLPHTVFVGSLPLSVTTAEIEEILHQVPEELGSMNSLILSDPTKFLKRIGWATFSTKEACSYALQELSGKKIGDKGILILKAERDESKRLHITPYITNSKKRILHDLHMSLKLAAYLDAQIGVDDNPLVPRYYKDNFALAGEVFEKPSEEKGEDDKTEEQREEEEKKKEENKKKLEEEIEKGLSSFERAAGDLPYLDAIIVYLRNVHFFCYYCGYEYESMNQMHRRCCWAHLRPGLEFCGKTVNDENGSSTEERSLVWAERNDEQITKRLSQETTYAPPGYEVTEADIEAAVGKFFEDNCVQLESERYQCNICEKKFLAPSFVHKHLRLKHQDQVAAVKNVVSEKKAFDNYCKDERRITEEYFMGVDGQITGGSKINRAMPPGVIQPPPPMEPPRGPLPTSPLGRMLPMRSVDSGGRRGPVRRERSMNRSVPYGRDRGYAPPRHIPPPMFQMLARGTNGPEGYVDLDAVGGNDGDSKRHTIDYGDI